MRAEISFVVQVSGFFLGCNPGGGLWMFENIRLSPAFLIRPSGPPSPRGKGSSYCFRLLGVRWRTEGLGRCGHRPLRIGGGTDLYRKSGFRPHSSSAPTYSLFTITYYFKLPRGKVFVAPNQKPRLRCVIPPRLFATTFPRRILPRRCGGHFPWAFSRPGNGPAGTLWRCRGTAGDR